MSESEGVSKSFDPRFSRAFQPGYDPRVHREEPPRNPLRDEPRSEQALAAHEADGVPIFAVSAPADLTDGAVGSAARHDAAGDDELVPREWWRRVNPWYLLLWALGVAFIVAGIVAAVSAVELQNPVFQSQEQSMVYFLLMQMTMQGAPMFIALGAATLTSTAVIQAARWQRH